MKKEEFINEVINEVAEAGKEDVESILERPSGRSPREKHIIQSEWYNTLKEEDKKVLNLVLTETVDATMYGMLAMLEGVRDLGNGYEGELKLYYEDRGGKVWLNNPEEESLHGIYNAIRNPED